jgi:hypothetical protein
VYNEVPSYFLAAHSYCCEVEDGAVILDLLNGTYIGIDADYLPDLRERIPNWPETSAANPASACISKRTDGNLIADLLSRGVLVTQPLPRRPPFSPTALVELRSDAGLRNQPRVPFRDLTAFLFAWFDARRRIGDKKLAALLEHLDRGRRLIRHGNAAITVDEVAKLMSSFLRTRLWLYTAAKHCLFDSAVLASFLTRHEVACTLVIGVSTKPFAAHAWIEFGPYVLNDTAEHIQLFKPILQIGHHP